MLNINIDDFDVKIYLRQDRYMLAQAEVSIGCLKISGFRVMKNKPQYGEDSVFVVEPRVKLGEKNYKSIFFLDDREQWGVLQNKIKNAYYEEIKNPPLNLNEVGVIDPKDIPI
ncbi:MAG: hypothetical protein WCO33_04950 [bacterium]